MNELPFGATNIKCPEGARSANDCSFDLYGNEEVPCFSGQELAVACADEKFTFEISRTAEKAKWKNGKGKGKFSAQIKVERYGLPMSSNVKLSLLNRSSKGAYSIIPSKFKYNKKTMAWTGKGLLSESDYCFIYVAAIGETHWTVAIGNCGYKGLTVAKVEEEINAMDSD